MKMKRLTAVLLLLFSLLLTVPMAGEGASAPALQNAGFEGWRSTSSLAFGWSVTKGGAALAVETADFTEGSLALRLTAAASQTSEAKAVQTVTGLSGGTLYELTADFKLPEALSAGFGFGMRLADSGGAEILSSGDPVSHTDGEWMQFACLFTAPTDGTANITLSFLPDGSGQKSLLLDNVKLQEAEKGKMKLYKSPVGYVLPGVVTSEAAAGQQLSAYYSGAVALSGGRAAEAGETVIARLVRPVGETPLALAASYGEDGKELLALEAFPGTAAYAAASLPRGKTVKGFLWEKSGLTPAGNSGQLAFPKEEKSIVQSGDFESYIGGTPQGWSAYSGWRGGFCFYETEEETGNHRMRVTDTAGGSAPYVYRRVPVAPGTQYRFSLYCKQQDMTDKGAGVKLEFYTKDKQYIGEHTEKFSQSTENQSFTFQTPAGTAEVAVLLRIYAAGTAYFDNVAMECISTPPAGSLLTDEYFYYPEWEKGTATVVANTVSFPAAEKGTFDIALLDGGTVLSSGSGLRLTNGEGTWDFPVSRMTETGKAYTVRATVYDESGQNIGNFETAVYQYPRPTVLDENGDYYVNGKLFVPKIAYHVTDYGNNTVNGKPEGAAAAEAQYKLLAEAGFNVVQMSTGNIYSPEACLLALDKLQEYGLMGLVTLYDKRVPPSRPERADRAKKVIEAVKDHPAVFAYAVYDEPAIGTDGLTEQDMIDSYRLVRDIDKKHPTYTVIAPGSSGANLFRPAVAKFTDVICYDPYVACWDSVVSTYVQEVHELAEAGVQHGRPLYSLLQVFDWRGFFPTADEYRHMWYQAAFGGAKGIGLYSFNDALMDAEGNYAIGLWTSDIWEDITAFADGEMQEAEKHFMHGEYPLFSEGETDDYRWRAWEKDGDVYMVILRTDEYTATSKEVAADVETAISLASTDGTKQIGNFSAACLYGGGADTAVTGNGTLTVTLGHRQALVYKISAK